MILSSFLGEAGFFRWASFHVLRPVAGPRTLLWALVFTAGTLSALLVNDTVHGHRIGGERHRARDGRVARPLPLLGLPAHRGGGHGGDPRGRLALLLGERTLGIV